MGWLDHALKLAAALRSQPWLRRGVVKIDTLRYALGLFAPAAEEDRIRKSLEDLSIEVLARMVSLDGDNSGHTVAMIVGSPDECTLNRIVRECPG